MSGIARKNGTLFQYHLEARAWRGKLSKFHEKVVKEEVLKKRVVKEKVVKEEVV